MWVAHDHQIGGLSHRQRSNEYGVDERVDRRVGADAKRESADHESGEGGVSAQGANAVGDVLSNLSGDSPPPFGRLACSVERQHVAAHAAHVPELFQRGRARILGRQPAGDEDVDARLEMKQNLVVDFADEAKPAERNAEDPAHARPFPSMLDGRVRIGRAGRKWCGIRRPALLH